MSVISTLLHNPYILGAYITLIGALFSCWVFKRVFLFAPLYLIAYALAYMGQIVNYLSLFPLVILLLCIFALKFHLKRFLHLFASLTLAIVGVGIMTHMIVGFNNFLLLANTTFGTSTTAINLYLNFPIYLKSTGNAFFSLTLHQERTDCYLAHCSQGKQTNS